MSNQKGFSLIIILLGIGLIILITIGYYYIGIKKSITSKSKLPQFNFSASTSPTTAPSMIATKNELLQSGDIDKIIKGIALDVIPNDKLQINIGDGDDDVYNLQRYGVPLTETQYNQFMSFLKKPGESTSESSDKYGENPDSLNWQIFGYAENSEILIKKGFQCVINTKYSDSVCGTGWSPCPKNYPVFKGLTCSYTSDPQKNTLENTSSFFKQELQEAGVDCKTQPCKVEQRGYGEQTIPQFARNILYFEDLNQTMDDRKALIKKEANDSLSAFQKAGWQAALKDTTKEDSFTNVTHYQLGLTITANNGQLKCTQNIILEVYRKREMIDCARILTTPSPSPNQQ